MDEDIRFREIMTTHGGRPGKPSPAFLEWLRTRGVSEQAITVVSGCVLKQAAGIGAIGFYSEKGILGANGEDFVPIAIRDGLLIVGGCPNGDLVAIDVREQLGAAGYIGHETMWQETSVRTVFLPLASSLCELAASLAAGSAPRDYHEALERPRNSTKLS